MQRLPMECLHHIAEFNEYKESNKDDDVTDIRALSVLSKQLRDYFRFSPLLIKLANDTTWSTLQKCLSYWTIVSIYLARTQLGYLQHPWTQHLRQCMVTSQSRTRSPPFVCLQDTNHALCYAFNTPILPKVSNMLFYSHSIDFCFRGVSFHQIYPSLQSLSIAGARCVDWSAIAMCPNLKIVTLLNSVITFENSRANFPLNLQSVFMQISVLLDDRLLEWFTMCKSLQRLTLDIIMCGVREMPITTLDFTQTSLISLCLKNLDNRIVKIVGLPPSLTACILPKETRNYVNLERLTKMCPTLPTILFK